MPTSTRIIACTLGTALRRLDPPFKHKARAAWQAWLDVNGEEALLLRELPRLQENFALVGHLLQAAMVDLLQRQVDGVLQV